MAELPQNDGNSQHSDSDDQDFDPSAEMMILEQDDERTLDEEEALSNTDSVSQELSQLENEKDMPIEHLLAMYGYGHRTVPPRIGGLSEGILGSEDLTLDKDEIARDLLQHTDHDRETSVNDLLDSVDIAASSQTVRLLRSTDPEQQLSNDEESSSSDDDSLDLDYEPRPEDWKKTIQVGNEYQADIPDCGTQYDSGSDDSANYLMWDPNRLPEDEVVRYLRECHELAHQLLDGIQSLPHGAHVYDDEETLHFLHKNEYRVDEALESRKKLDVLQSEPGPFSQWSEEECRNFENGLCIYGKNFFLIHQNKIPMRSVSDLVQFYYLWKKTERHDFFAGKFRLEKKKYALHPGITDYMDRFLDEAENMTGSPAVNKTERVGSPGIRSLLSTDAKQRSHEDEQVAAEEGGHTLAEGLSAADSTIGTQLHCFLPIKDMDYDGGLCSSNTVHDVQMAVAASSSWEQDDGTSGVDSRVHSSTGVTLMAGGEGGVGGCAAEICEEAKSSAEDQVVLLPPAVVVNGVGTGHEAAVLPYNGISPPYNRADSTFSEDLQVVASVGDDSSSLTGDIRLLQKRSLDSIADDADELLYKRVRLDQSAESEASVAGNGSSSDVVGGLGTDCALSVSGEALMPADSSSFSSSSINS